MAAPLDIADLLEREEKKAKDRLRQAQLGTDGGGDQVMAETTPEPELKSSRDPRRLDRPADLDSPRTSKPDDETRRDWSSKDRYTNEREENDERRARRSREDEANGGSDKESANGSVRSKRRSRSPRPDSRRGHRDRRDDYYRPGARSSVDRDDDFHYRPKGDRRRDDRPRSRDRGSGRDRGGRDDRDRRGGGGRGERGDRDSRRSPQGGKPTEPTDDERDRRTVFVQQLAARLRSRELKDFFEQAGSVVDAQIVKDRVSGRSKGVGYVEFKEEESVQKAIALTGQKLLGIPIIAQLTEAEKNRQARTTEGTATQSNGIPFHRLYVGNIHFSITEDDLKNVFEPFGELEFVQLQKEEAGRSKGYGFVQFIDPTQAKEALEKMNGFELAGRPIRVGLGNDKFTPESTQSLLQRFGGGQANTQGSSFSGMGGRGAHAGGTGNFDRTTARDVDKTGGASALDDTDVGGVNFSNYSRDALMRKLARTDEPEQKMAPKTQQVKKAVVEQPTATRCVLLKNMYDQNTETDPNWQDELKEDVKGECDEKYGKVVHIGLALDNNDGEIYIKFDRVQGGENAIRGLNGRWFGGRMITAQYVVDAVYHMNFPKAAQV
ncbi:RNA-binding protein rsd1 [Fulvia fulva]|uniref:RNA-binding protein rsd1 n=1 Tax=Passalora fulva TaxID=5499 RepID=A0A9Q8LC11_PASFU|nr:RNA-binding protein rsd1 [Fulvia fulva]KAK4631625.1 RNA-binding protein rsd1 [Fulvia fulva]UJO14590.1 RNA-binding protein rsd1 [Fulvia fulva]WPV10648.1 RNA-binding protein rsd1 [Fulvia fulva]WPV26153.1 RNA-binding protein rsd1 [Fulvia fulva]